MNTSRLATFLIPVLPALASSDPRFNSETVPYSEDDWRKAIAIWVKLQSIQEYSEDLQIAAAQIVSKPDSEARKSVFQEELEMLLREHPDIAKAIDHLLQGSPADTLTTRITQQVKGNQNQVIGQMLGGQVFGGSGSDSVATDGVTVSAFTSNHAVGEPSTSVKTILVLAANPKGTHPLRLGEEVRKLQEGLARSQHREHFCIEQRWAVTPTDVRRALLDCQPQVVHFSGHGVGVESSDEDAASSRKLSVVSRSASASEGLMFEDEAGQPKLISTEAIASLFSLFADQVECVVLNACYSATQANAIVQHIPYVIGMKQAIGDRAAIEFAIGFYDALLANRTVEFAYRLGCTSIQMEGIPEHLTPVLKQKST